MKDIEEIRERFIDRVKVEDLYDYTKCWHWNRSIHHTGYGNFYMYGRWYGAHVASWILFRSDKLNNLCVLHSCDNPACVNPFHLFLGTDKDNMKDKINKGRQTKGLRHGSAWMTFEQVCEIRKLYKLESLHKLL